MIENFLLSSNVRLQMPFVQEGRRETWFLIDTCIVFHGDGAKLLLNCLNTIHALETIHSQTYDWQQSEVFVR